MSMSVFTFEHFRTIKFFSSTFNVYVSSLHLFNSMKSFACFIVIVELLSRNGVQGRQSNVPTFLLGDTKIWTWTWLGSPDYRIACEISTSLFRFCTCKQMCVYLNDERRQWQQQQRQARQERPTNLT